MTDEYIDDQWADEDLGIVFDTETTGLPAKGSAPLEKQPSIIEYAGIKFKMRTMEEVGRLTFLAKPPQPISAKITEITGLTNDDLKDVPKFTMNVEEVTNFHMGVRGWYAHNFTFDRNMMIWELKRLKKHMAFPYPPHQVCTVQESYSINNHRLNLTKLHAHYFSEDSRFHDDDGNYTGFEAHRAMNDVEALFDILKAMRLDKRV